MFVVVQVELHHECMWAESIGFTIMRGEHVKPEHAHHDHFLKHQSEEVHEGNQIIHAPCLLLDCSDKPFDLRYMFIISAAIQARSCSGQGSLQCLKFTVSMNHLDKTTTRIIQMHHYLEGFCNHILLVIQQQLNSTKLDVLGYCERKGNLLTSMMLMHRVMEQYNKRISGGMGVMDEETCASVHWMVLPLRECTLGLKMSSAAKILALVMGELGNKCQSMICRKLCVEG